MSEPYEVLKRVIDQEIDWSIANAKENNISDKQLEWYVKGLNQALYLARTINLEPVE